jgi:hypothetical protein
MSKHTPGPWLHQGAMNSRQILVGTPKPEDRAIQYGEAIAAVNMCVSPESGMVDETAIANARLIAAAPDLLAALKLAVAKTVGTDPKHPWIHAARDAIAKAEGTS